MILQFLAINELRDYYRDEMKHTYINILIKIKLEEAIAKGKNSSQIKKLKQQNQNT